MTSHREITIVESEDDERSSRNPSGSGQGDMPSGPVEDGDRDEAESRTQGLDLIYDIEASPSWYLSLIFGFQVTKLEFYLHALISRSVYVSACLGVRVCVCVSGFSLPWGHISIFTWSKSPSRLVQSVRNKNRN